MAMLLFYALNVYNPSTIYRMVTVVSGAVQAFAVFLFFYNMLMTLFTKVEQH
jgi:hypothetical protein